MLDENQTANVTVESDGVKISVSVTGSNAVKKCERLLDQVFDWVDEDEDDED